MAKDKNVLSSSWATFALVAVAVLVLAGIVYYAWSTRPEDNTETTETTTTQENTTVADVDALGPREVLLTPDNFEEVTSRKGVVLVDMYLPTCSHCQKIAPILTELSNEYGDKLVVAKMSAATDVNRDFILGWDESFNSVPTITIYKDGEKVDTFTGERTKQEFKDLIDLYL